MIKSLTLVLLLLNSLTSISQIRTLEDTLSNYLNEVKKVTFANKEFWGIDLYSPIFPETASLKYLRNSFTSRAAFSDDISIVLRPVV